MGRQQDVVACGGFYFKKRVDCGVINALDVSDNLSIQLINDCETNDFSPRNMFIIAVGKVTWEENLTTGELSGTLF